MLTGVSAAMLGWGPEHTTLWERCAVKRSCCSGLIDLMFVIDFVPEKLCEVDRCQFRRRLLFWRSKRVVGDAPEFSWIASVSVDSCTSAHVRNSATDQIHAPTQSLGQHSLA